MEDVLKLNSQSGKRQCSKSDCSHRSTCGAPSSCVSTTRQQRTIQKTEKEQPNKNLIPIPANLVQLLNDAHGNVINLISVHSQYILSVKLK